jgi:hypothetical protein
MIVGFAFGELRLKSPSGLTSKFGTWPPVAIVLIAPSGPGSARWRRASLRAFRRFRAARAPRSSPPPGTKKAAH